MNIVPRPKKIELKEGSSTFRKSLYLPKELSSNVDIFLENLPGIVTEDIDLADIVVCFDSSLEREEYKIDIDRVIEIRAGHRAGLLYSVMSLIQIIEINGPWIESALIKIEDSPKFSWRGSLMDVARHHFSIKFIKKYLKTLALHKINRFHWHLTDDQGWRIEIKKYPELTEIGSVREGTTVNHGPYKGYYTQDEVKEVIEYASKLNIDVIPEIDIPGHATAAIASIRELSCIDEELNVATKWGIHNKILCAGKEFVFNWLEDVLKEIAELFPSRYIHIGGDEAKKDYWEKCPLCKKRMEDEAIDDMDGLQFYFINRVSDIVKSLEKEVLGWDEIIDGGLIEGATIFSWRGVEAGVLSANKGHKVVMCPTKSACYFDHRPNSDPDEVGRLGVCTVKDAWDFNPYQPGISETAKKNIIGLQGNIWTEEIKFPYIFEYLAFPRVTALSETMWYGTENRDWEEFKKRLSIFKNLLIKKGVNFYNGVLE